MLHSSHYDLNISDRCAAFPSWNICIREISGALNVKQNVPGSAIRLMYLWLTPPPPRVGK